ncbi:hypothetical protein FACS189429_2290 [Bacteroidia bacterium]|nr:hypothetical protein FACS189429_2290 [Bacteroidia bacterium]GHV44982.1 hypothetical protein FACS1894180_7000 [Bacteroidia bacterium]
MNRQNINTLKTVLILFAIIISNFANAQNGAKSTLPSRDKAIKYAYACLNGVGVQLNYKKSAKIFFALAKSGDAEANNAIGMMYKHGLGTAINNEKAFKYFSRADSLGYAKAASNLALMYKNGDFVEQNLEMAQYLLEKSDSLGNTQTDYMRGYMYYKGQGVPQSYERAMEFFRAGADKGSGACMFFLGLCYFKGQGVERNRQEGKHWIDASAEVGYQRAIDFMAHENSQQYGEKKGPNSKHKSVISNALETVKPTKFLKILNAVTDRAVAGEWAGDIVIYDWSGVAIEDEIPIRASINVFGCDLTGLWIQNDTVETPMNVTMADSVWIFNNLKIDLKRPADVREGKFRIEEHNGETFLVGSIDAYSPKLREYIRPAMVVMRRVFAAPADTEPENAFAGNFTANPIPFKDFLDIHFNIADNQEVIITLFDMNGKKMYEQTATGIAGHNELQIPTATLPQASYLVRLTADNRYQTIKTVKQ